MTINAFPEGSFPSATWPDRTWPIASGIFVRFAEVWRAIVTMTRRVSENVTMTRKVSDDYDELEQL